MNNQELITKSEPLPPEVAALPTIQGHLDTIEMVSVSATNIVITDADAYKSAAELAQRLAGAIKKLEDERLSVTRPMDAAKKKVMDWFRTPVARLEDAQTQLRKKMIGYTTEQERIAAEARKKAEDEARERREAAERAAAEERRKAKAEEDRIAEEARVVREAEDAERRRAEQAAAAGDIAAQEEAEAIARQQRNERLRLENQQRIKQEEAEQRAQAIEAEAQKPVIAPVIEAPVKAAGISQRKVAKYEIVDRDKISEVYWKIDEEAIAKTVRAMGLKAVDLVGTGIKVWMEDDISVRARR